MEKWIPVTERLPEKDEHVLCTTVTAKGRRSVVRGYYSGKVWVCGMNSNVIAWQPLPDPYEEHEEVEMRFDEEFEKVCAEIKLAQTDEEKHKLALLKSTDLCVALSGCLSKEFDTSGRINVSVIVAYVAALVKTLRLVKYWLDGTGQEETWSTIMKASEEDAEVLAKGLNDWM